MEGFSVWSLFLLSSLLLIVLFTGESTNKGGDDKEEINEDGVYIVYMGAATTPNGSPRPDHLHLLDYLSTRKRNTVIYNYKNGFSGFAARLSKTDADLIAQQPGVVSVFPDPLLQLHTTRSWDFLKLNYQSNPKINPNSDYNSCNIQSLESNIIIGVIDSGIWPESESFNDTGMDPIPSQWKGVCMEGIHFNSSNCNKKLIGARYYANVEPQTPRDFYGHGTHVASIAAGRVVPNISYYGLAAGMARGGSPKSRIAVYRVCSAEVCSGSAILAAFDDAIVDGVDVLSMSIGFSSFDRPILAHDPLAIGAFHAVERGIVVVCSAGNEGPKAKTVINDAPWMFTVAATTIDRSFETNVVLRGNKVIKGEGIHFGNIRKAPLYPLVYGKLAKANCSKEDEARNCNKDSLDENKIKGKIVLCYNDDDAYYAEDRINEVKRKGGIGLVLVNDLGRIDTLSSDSFPATAITSKEAVKILSYITSTRKPMATILPTRTTIGYKPAPIVPYFSSKGPSMIMNLLKPDIAAPGVNILAAWIENDTSQAPVGKEPPLFTIMSGTSMACPHVSGVAAIVKSQHPTWNPSAIRSAIMTTATQTNNLRTRITNEFGLAATSSDYGAGVLNPSESLQPGLIYEIDSIDYFLFLCYYGYDLSIIRLISATLPNGFACPENSTTDSISNINYPSIAIFNFGGKQSTTVNRTVTNVGIDINTIYWAMVEAPARLDVKIVPSILRFTENDRKLTYQVTFSSLKYFPLKEEACGSITWTNGKYKVHSPFTVIT